MSWTSKRSHHRFNYTSDISYLDFGLSPSEGRRDAPPTLALPRAVPET